VASLIPLQLPPSPMLLLRSGSNSRTTCRLSACITPILASIGRHAQRRASRLASRPATQVPNARRWEHGDVIAGAFELDEVAAARKVDRIVEFT
jgi:hypothetical protein